MFSRYDSHSSSRNSLTWVATLQEPPSGVAGRASPFPKPIPGEQAPHSRYARSFLPLRSWPSARRGRVPRTPSGPPSPRFARGGPSSRGASSPLGRAFGPCRGATLPVAPSELVLPRYARSVTPCSSLRSSTAAKLVPRSCPYGLSSSLRSSSNP